MWGIRHQLFFQLAEFGITPTCVGNTNLYIVNLVYSLLRDHPHMCGEYPYIMSINNIDLGSPPHVWGILFHLLQCRKNQRITPTCVGNTKARKSRIIFCRDHPHMCGEYLFSPSHLGSLQGSPPHVWGIQKKPIGQALSPGITPTCVGNTALGDQRSTPGQDHPHMCGEYNFAVFVSYALPGSPPHVWGIH